MFEFMPFFWAFLVGGSLCAGAQILIDRTKLAPARILVLYVIGGVVLGAVGLYPRLISLAGAGASVPLSGFGALIAKGVREAVEREGLIGALTGGLKQTAGGIAAALIFGYLASLFARGKPRS